MGARDDIRPKGTVEVQCSAPDCDWYLWVRCDDSRLPDGPFWCVEHDPKPFTGEKGDGWCVEHDPKPFTGEKGGMADGH